MWKAVTAEQLYPRLVWGRKRKKKTRQPVDWAVRSLSVHLTEVSVCCVQPFWGGGGCSSTCLLCGPKFNPVLGLLHLFLSWGLNSGGGWGTHPHRAPPGGLSPPSQGPQEPLDMRGP